MLTHEPFQKHLQASRQASYQDDENAAHFQLEVAYSVRLRLKVQDMEKESTKYNEKKDHKQNLQLKWIENNNKRFFGNE